MTQFVGGLLVMGYAVAAVFFARFWRETSDRLFIWFAVAFALLALQRALLTTSGTLPLTPTWYFAIRLIAFLFILVAIVDKNSGSGATR